MKAPVRYLNYSLHDNFSNKDLIKKRCVFNLYSTFASYDGCNRGFLFVCYSQVSMKRASLLNNCYYSGAPVAFKTWCGHQFREGIIYPPGGDRVKVAAKTWCGHVPTSTCPQARLLLLSELARFIET